MLIVRFRARPLSGGFPAYLPMCSGVMMSASSISEYPDQVLRFELLYRDVRLAPASRVSVRPLTRGQGRTSRGTSGRIPLPDSSSSRRAVALHLDCKGIQLAPARLPDALPVEDENFVPPYLAALVDHQNPLSSRVVTCSFKSPSDLAFLVVCHAALCSFQRLQGARASGLQ